MACFPGPTLLHHRRDPLAVCCRLHIQSFGERVRYSGSSCGPVGSWVWLCASACFSRGRSWNMTSLLTSHCICAAAPLVGTETEAPPGSGLCWVWLVRCLCSAAPAGIALVRPLIKAPCSSQGRLVLRGRPRRSQQLVWEPLMGQVSKRGVTGQGCFPQVHLNPEVCFGLLPSPLRALFPTATVSIP